MPHRVIMLKEPDKNKSASMSYNQLLQTFKVVVLDAQGSQLLGSKYQKVSSTTL